MSLGPFAPIDLFSAVRLGFHPFSDPRLLGLCQLGRSMVCRGSPKGGLDLDVLGEVALLSWGSGAKFT